MIYVVVARETLTDVSSSTGFTAANIPPTNLSTIYAILQAVDGDVRFTIDGTAPTSSLGMRLLQDDSVEIWGSEGMTNFRCIDDGGSANPEVVYMGTA